MNNKKVLILGGGPTALASAVRLAQAGFNVKLIERLPWVGGLSKTFERGPYKLDLGPHRFTPHSQEVLDFVSNLLDGKLATVQYKAEIWLAERLIGYPFKIKELLTRMPPVLAVKLLVSFMLSSLGGKKEAKTYEEWITKHFGTAIRELVFRPLVEKVWGTPLSQLSARFARQRIATTNLWEIAWEAITGRRTKQFHSDFYPDNGFLYPPEGFGLITDRMAAEFVKFGGKIEIDATVTRVFTENNRISGVAYDQKGKEVIESPDFVISTIPIQYFTKILSPAVPAPVMAAADRLKTRRLVLLYLVLKMDRFSKNTSLYFPSQEFLCGRVWEQKNHSADTIPVKDRTVLGLEIPCWDQDAIWTASDSELYERAVAPFVRHGLLKKTDVEEYFTVKLGYVYPVWDVHFEENLDVILNHERKIENLILNGRPGLFFYNNLHHSLEMGFVAANHVISGLPKTDKWNKDACRFEQYRLVE